VDTIYSLFFSLSWHRNPACEHFGYFLLCLLCASQTWLSSDNHFACTSLLSPSGVVDTHQYRLLTMLFCHSLTSLQSFCFLSFYENVHVFIFIHQLWIYCRFYCAWMYNSICDPFCKKGSYSLTELLSLIHHNSSCFQPIDFICTPSHSVM